jgi:hypothetical protein
VTAAVLSGSVGTNPFPTNPSRVPRDPETYSATSSVLGTVKIKAFPFRKLILHVLMRALIQHFLMFVLNAFLVLMHVLINCMY